MARAGALAIMGLLLASTGWARQYDQGTQPTLEQTKPGQVKGADGKAPVVSKEESNAYKAVYDGRNGDPAHTIELGEAFLAKYPKSVYKVAVYTYLTTAYMGANQTDKMIEAGNKALELSPDNVDVLPVLAWAIPRRVNAQTPDGPQLLQKAQGYARHGIELINALTKPLTMDDETFEKAKNEKLSMLHDGLGVVAVKTGKFDDAIPELTQSIQLAVEPDPVDFYLLGVADESTNHFTDAIASFTKCAGNGPMQAQCKGLIDEAKKKAQNNLEAPK